MQRGKGGPNSSMSMSTSTKPLMKFSWVFQLALSILSGVLIALGLPPWNITWLIWIAFVPMLVSLLIIPGGPGLVILQGVFLAAANGLMSFHWLWREHRYDELGAVLGFLALQTVVWSWFLWRFCRLPSLPKPPENKRKKGPEPIFLGAPGNAEAWRISTAHLRLATLIAGAWTFLEWSRGMVFPAWNPAGLPVGASLPLLQLVKVTGPAGLSFIAVFANAILFLAARRFALRPGRISWAARFDVIVTLAILFVISAAGFRLGQQAPQPLQLRVCLTASPDESVEGLSSILPAAAALRTDLLVWRRVNLGSNRFSLLRREEVAPNVGIVVGQAFQPDAPISGCGVFLPSEIRSFVSPRQNQPVFRAFSSQQQGSLRNFMLKDVAFVPFLNHEAMSFAVLKSAVRAPGQAFIVLMDMPKGTAIEENQFWQNVRCWAVSLGRPIIFESRRAGAFLATGNGRILTEMAPGTKMLSAPTVDFPLPNDLTLYASFGDWLPILTGALCLFLGIRERLSNFYASPRRFRT
jgi:apolipoprotein N-acyltransferase